MLEPNIPGALDDTFLRDRIAAIVNALGLTTIVETGVCAGKSTYYFCQMVPRAIGVDNDQLCLDAAKERCAGAASLELRLGNSPTVLAELFAAGLDASKTLFFLDAHWEKYWPLPDEVAALPRGQGVIVVHDAVVPDSPDLQTDGYSYGIIRGVLTAWSQAHYVAYNSSATANGPRCGVMYVFTDEAAYLRTI